MTACLKPSTWIFLRGAGRRLVHASDDVAISNLILEIGHARAEGATWDQIADAALLPVATVRRYGDT
jgi:hypothetical protein